ncbi:MAG: response regulator [Acidobacteria bacterium]|nr:response regulator [Acidobacteriota bacterium]
MPDSTSPFVGTSDMAARMRAYDWARTPLGPVTSWPSSLRTVIRVLLTSRFAMWMGWGPELTFLYNDAYASMTLGRKHPWALGRASREVWAEIWPDIGPRIESVLQTGQASWDEALLLFLERGGFPEETYHTFSYSPLSDDDGQVRGHLCVVTEDTHRVIGERRIATLRDVAAAIAAVTTEEGLYSALSRVLSERQQDVPFSVMYLLQDGGRTWQRVCSSGVSPAHDVAPDTTDGESPWPLNTAHRGEVRVEGLDARFHHVPSGPWHLAPRTALLVPIGEQGQADAAGVFVAALNPLRPDSDDDVTFVRLLVGQVAAALANVRSYEEARRRAEALAEIDRAKTAFFANVSHEFRTPLTLLLGPLEDALGRGEPLAQTELDTAYRNALRLLKLVNALLDFARIEAGRARAQFAPVDIAALTSDIASVFRTAVERAGLRFRIETNPISEPIFIDVDMWEKVVLNLLSNAFKFTFDGEIAVEVEDGGDAANIRVIDTGIGVPADELPRLFERFHRVEGARGRTHEGSGIGLALVRDLVALHGGEISATSVENGGTTFVVRLRKGRAHLPAEQVLEAATTPARRSTGHVEEALRWLEPATAITPASTPDRSTSRIVVADDNADLREYLGRLLGELGDVEVVSDGVAALEALKRRPADLLLTDVMMPRMDGISLIHAIRADADLKTLPVIMLSARSGEEARIEGLHAGADDYIFKPFSAREVVARVSSQLQLLAARRHAATERDRLRDLLSQVPAVVNFLSGPDLVFEFAHPLAEKATGRTLTGRAAAEALPEYRSQPGVFERLRQVYDTGEPIAASEVPLLIERDGRVDQTYWNIVYLPVRSPSGAIEGVMTFDIEVTEQVRARQLLETQALELHAARESAETANRAKDEFLAMLGHELRNPLAPIVTALQLLRLRGHASRELDVLDRQVFHLSRLVDDLLDVSRIARGKIELRLSVVEMASVIARAVETASPLLEQRRQPLQLDVPTSGLRVTGDEARLAQVVANLLTNASKYSDEGSPISMRAYSDAGQAVVRVRDYGMGMTEDMLSTVFDLFVQHPQAIDRARGGLGLGLTIVQGIVERHGGTVFAHSEGLGRGSEFIVRLPLTVHVPDGRGDTGITAPGTARVHDALRVLIVDDNRDAAEMIGAALQMHGYTTAVAFDGPDALALAPSFQPDVALLDIGLPAMDGYELAGRLRAMGLTGLTLVAVSGYGQVTDQERSHEAGFDAHLVKPVDLDQLHDTITSLRASQ